MERFVEYAQGTPVSKVAERVGVEARRIIRFCTLFIAAVSTASLQHCSATDPRLFARWRSPWKKLLYNAAGCNTRDSIQYFLKKIHSPRVSERVSGEFRTVGDLILFRATARVYARTRLRINSAIRRKISILPSYYYVDSYQVPSFGRKKERETDSRIDSHYRFDRGRWRLSGWKSGCQMVAPSRARASARTEKRRSERACSGRPETVASSLLPPFSFFFLLSRLNLSLPPSRSPSRSVTDAYGRRTFTQRSLRSDVPQ